MKPQRFGHAVLRSYDLPGLKDWYCSVLDAEVVLDLPMVALLTFDDEHHRLGINQMSGEPVAPSAKTPGLAHLAYGYGTVDELLDQYLVMKGRGVTPNFCIHHGATLSFYYSDPDGNGVEFFTDVFSTNDDLAAYFASPGFARNPIGQPRDPEELLAQRAAGASAAELLSYDPEIEMDLGAYFAQIEH